MAFRPRRVISGALVLVTVATSALVFGRDAEAFKPYTHIQTGYDAWTDATDDGNVTINDVEYTGARPGWCRRCSDYPSYYNAGVIGPDGFPDLTMGQSVVHPEDTGRWLAFLLDAAWDAQQPGATPSGGGAPYSEDEKLQILAFTYGFMTHAAGDTWAHTLVNELSAGHLSRRRRHPHRRRHGGDRDPSPARRGLRRCRDGGIRQRPRTRRCWPAATSADDSTAGMPNSTRRNRFVYDTLVRQRQRHRPATRGAR